MLQPARRSPAGRVVLAVGAAVALVGVTAGPALAHTAAPVVTPATASASASGGSTSSSGSTAASSTAASSTGASAQPSADLHLAYRLETDPVRAGGTVVGVVTVSNSGPDAAPHTTVRITAMATTDSASSHAFTWDGPVGAHAGVIDTLAVNQVDWVLASLPVGGRQTLTFRFLAHVAASGAVSFSPSSDVVDPNPFDGAGPSGDYGFPVTVLAAQAPAPPTAPSGAPSGALAETGSTSGRDAVIGIGVVILGAGLTAAGTRRRPGH